MASQQREARTDGQYLFSGSTACPFLFSSKSFNEGYPDNMDEAATDIVDFRRMPLRRHRVTVKIRKPIKIKHVVRPVQASATDVRRMPEEAWQRVHAMFASGKRLQSRMDTSMTDALDM